VLLVATFGIYTGVSTSVTDKRRDIAILRAMGFGQADVQTIFVIEGMAVGLAGAAGGFLLGSALLEALANAPITLNGQTAHLPLDRSLAQYAVAGGVCLLAALVAAWLPARRAGQVDPVDILRGAA
jgi:lipoprotein-releasing system permease protein